MNDKGTTYCANEGSDRNATIEKALGHSFVDINTVYADDGVNGK